MENGAEIGGHPTEKSAVSWYVPLRTRVPTGKRSFSAWIGADPGWNRKRGCEHLEFLLFSALEEQNANAFMGSRERQSLR